MRRLAWVLTILYLSFLALWSGMILAEGFSGVVPWLALLALMLFTQVLFIVVPASADYLMPTRPRRLFIPALIAALMMTTLIGTLVFALAELFRIEKSDVGGTWAVVAFWTVMVLSWIAWTAVFFAATRRLDRFRWMRRMVVLLIGGSLLQLLATVPSHIIVTRRPGCLVGLSTALGVLGGLYVMCWSFGPGIVLLFTAEVLKVKPGHCPGCGYNLHGLSEPRCPECGREFTFAEIRMSPDELDYHGEESAKPA
jgi:hypothetical protein